MAKDTEKLIRQLSLISYLMAERRPVTAPEIRRDVEGYSVMNEDAFARRFYADRSELEALGIVLTVERPADGPAEQENYSLPPENFHLPAIEFTDKELAALQTALHLLDGEFAYAEPLRLALQQISWGRPSPLQRARAEHGRARDHRLGRRPRRLTARLAKIETAIFRRKTIVFDYYTMERDEVGARKVDPYQLIFQGGQFYLVGRSHERKAIRVFRLSRIRGKVSYATKAEHDFRRPVDFDPRAYANRVDWQFGEAEGVAEIQVSERIAWQMERHFGRYGEIRQQDSETVFATSYSNPRGIISWVLGLGGNARLLAPEELIREFDRRLELLEERHQEGALAAAASAARPPSDSQGSAAAGAGSRSRSERRADKAEAENGRVEAAIRPERFARLVTLASILIRAGRAGEQVSVAEVRERLQLSDEELREDVNVLNVVNFGGGSYVLYAEITDDGQIDVDPEPYSDNFDRPARLLPVEAKALVAAIDLIGEHLPEGSLTSAREKIVAALGEDPMDQGLQVATTGADDSDVARRISKAIAQRKLIELEYYKENEDELTSRTVEPYALTNGREGWYVASFDPARDGVRHFRLDRIKQVSITTQKFKPRPEVDPAAEVDGWLRTGEVPASAMARVWISPERARWAREARRVVGECRDGAVIVELCFAGVDWLVREVLKEAGDAAVIEPEDAREAVLAALARVREASSAAAVA